MKDVPSSMSKARFGVIPNHSLLCKLPRRRCKRIKLSYESGCFVAVRREIRLFRFIRFAYSCGIISDRTRFMPSPVSRRHTDVWISVVEIPYGSKRLYVGLEVRTTSIDVGADSRSSRLSAPVCLGLLVEKWLSGWLNIMNGWDRFELLLTWAREVLLALLRVVSVTSCTCCTNSGRVTFLKTLAEEPLSSSFSGSSRNIAPSAKGFCGVLRKRNQDARDGVAVFFNYSEAYLGFSVGNLLCGFAGWPSKWSPTAQIADSLGVGIFP